MRCFQKGITHSCSMESVLEATSSWVVDVSSLSLIRFRDKLMVLRGPLVLGLSTVGCSSCGVEALSAASIWIKGCDERKAERKKESQKV